MRKNAEAVDGFQKKHPLRKVRGKYGEPKDWDGFAILFVLLVKDDRTGVTRSEMEWYEALTRESRTTQPSALKC